MGANLPCEMMFARREHQGPVCTTVAPLFPQTVTLGPMLSLYLKVGAHSMLGCRLPWSPCLKRQIKVESSRHQLNGGGVAKGLMAFSRIMPVDSLQELVSLFRKGTPPPCSLFAGPEKGTATMESGMISATESIYHDRRRSKRFVGLAEEATPMVFVCLVF